MGAGTGNQQCGFGEAIAWIKCLRSETTGRESLGETLDGFMPNRFRATVGEQPLAKIEGCFLFGRDFACAHFIGKIRRAADRGMKTSNSFQPTIRPINKSSRR